MTQIVPEELPDYVATFGEIGSPETNTIQVRLGGKFQCPCGEVVPVEGGWLAAHWHEALTCQCSNKDCRQRFSLTAGKLKLRGKPYGSRKHKWGE